MLHKYKKLLCGVVIFSLNIAPSYSEEKDVVFNPAIKIDALEQEVRRIAGRNTGNVGVAVRHLETCQGFSLNGDRLFFMASTYKIPMAVRILQLVDQSKLSLDDMVRVRDDDYVPWSLIADRFNRGPVALYISNLLELMLVLSDNTATDVILRTAGGGKAVTVMLREQGIKKMTVSRPVKDFMAALVRSGPLSKLMKEEGLSFAAAWVKMINLEKVIGAKPDIVEYLYKGVDDKATPESMLKLLQNIWMGDILSDKSRTVIQGIMERCETGPARIKGKLPKGTVVKHKTGTVGTSQGVINNVGVIRCLIIRAMSPLSFTQQTGDMV